MLAVSKASAWILQKKSVRTLTGTSRVPVAPASMLWSPAMTTLAEAPLAEAPLTERVQARRAAQQQVLWAPKGSA